MKFRLFIILLGFSFSQCNEKKEVLVIHERLLGVKSVFAGYLNDKEFNKNEKKIEQNKIIIDYKDEFILVTNWNYVNGCGNPVGNIQIANDTIFLKYIETNEILCTELIIKKVSYFIDNPDNMKWVIIQ